MSDEPRFDQLSLDEELLRAVREAEDWDTWFRSLSPLTPEEARR